jgi:plastocyanin
VGARWWGISVVSAPAGLVRQCCCPRRHDRGGFCRASGSVKPNAPLIPAELREPKVWQSHMPIWPWLSCIPSKTVVNAVLSPSHPDDGSLLDEEDEMRRFYCSRSGLTIRWAAPLALLLVTIGPIAVTSRTAAAQPAATSLPPIEATTVGKVNTWNPKDVQVALGDKIVWKNVSGKHGVEFSPAACKVAEKKLKFTPPLEKCKSQTLSEPGTIVEAEVIDALTAKLSYHCTVHGTKMPGLLDPKK